MQFSQRIKKDTGPRGKNGGSESFCEFWVQDVNIANRSDIKEHRQRSEFKTNSYDHN